MADCTPIEARSLGFSYQNHSVLCDLSFTLAPGEILGVLGPNGAGKSTLLKLLAGLLVPSHGEIRVMGERVNAGPRSLVARRVAMVPQRERALFGVTAGEVVAMGRAPHTGWFGALRTRDTEAVARAMARCHCAELAPRPFSALSGGEQKRVLVARALAQQTPVVLLDEPIAFLDIQHQIALCDLLAEGAARGDFSAVVVLHDLNIAAQYCHRLMLLREGRVRALGAVAEVMTYGRIRETFEAEVYVGVNEINNSRFFVPMRATKP